MPTEKTIDQMTDEELDDMLYRSPRTLINKVRTEERAAARAEGQQGEFWRRFYDKFPNLRPDAAIVETVLMRNFDRLKDRPAEDGMMIVADLAEKEIEAIRRRWTRQREYSVMKGGPGIPADQVNVAPEEGASLGSVINERRDRRREASHMTYRAAAEE